jgi:ANTAR domain
MMGTSADGSVAALRLASVVDNQVVLGVRGPLNLFRAPDVRAILEAVIDRGHRLVVLDVAQTGFIDATGLQVIIEVAGLTASDQAMSDVDAEQYAIGERPCLDASLEGRWSYMRSVDGEHRRPAFVPKARELGINAILSNSLIVTGRPVGPLNVYSRTAGAFGTEEPGPASVVADKASVILASAAWGTSTAAVAGRRTAVVRASQVIAQATGVVMEREGISEENAFTTLRRSSQRSGPPRREHAEGVVASTGVSGLNHPTSSI